MVNDMKKTVFRQVEIQQDGMTIGVLFSGVGLLFLFLGIRFLFIGEFELALWTIIGLIVFCVGISLLLCYSRRIEFDSEEIRLMIGSVVLRRMCVSEVKTLGYAVVRPMIRGANWGFETLVLSPRTASHMIAAGRVGLVDADPEIEHLQKHGYWIERKEIHHYINDSISFFRMKRGEGIWLEYSAERIMKLKELLPNAEDCASQ